MKLIDNLNAIKDCKDAIEIALKNKGVDMTGVAFSGYAEKIDELQLSSGDEPSTPTPSADYIYSNGYIDGGKTNEIINLVPYKIEWGNMGNDGQFEIELICPVEIPVYTFENYDIIFTVDVPQSYNIIYLAYYDELNTAYKEIYWDSNPRYDNGIIERGDIVYNSYVRKLKDGYMGNDGEISISTVKYKIIIENR